MSKIDLTLVRFELYVFDHVPHLTIRASMHKNQILAKLYLTSSLNSEDNFTFKISSDLENLKVSLVKTANYEGDDREEPPRKMGDGFAILQSAEMKLFYHQDILGERENEQKRLERKRNRSRRVNFRHLSSAASLKWKM